MSPLFVGNLCRRTLSPTLPASALPFIGPLCRPPLVVQSSGFKVQRSKFTILADPASDTSALAAWVDEAQWLDRSGNHTLADRLPDTSALGSAIDEAQ